MEPDPGAPDGPTDPPRIDGLERLETTATWDSLVLPEEELRSLHQLADQLENRARVFEEWGFGPRMGHRLGITALFVGETGTGKSLAAEVVANSLGRSLYRVDLSAVVRQYIGETEKNLSRLFDAAEVSDVVLFFDEADALFGKRSEVRDSHDRFANLEVDSLLTMMQSYVGISILATNARGNLDPAFIRRLRFIVNFPFPGPSERRRIWDKVFPPAAPVVGLDHDRLASIAATGGMIHDIALNAAFRAAHDGTPITMDLVLDAAQADLRKRGVASAEEDARSS